MGNKVIKNSELFDHRIFVYPKQREPVVGGRKKEVDHCLGNINGLLWARLYFMMRESWPRNDVRASGPWAVEKEKTVGRGKSASSSEGVQVSNGGLVDTRRRRRTINRWWSGRHPSGSNQTVRLSSCTYHYRLVYLL